MQGRDAAQIPGPLIEYAIATRVLAGERECGDCQVVKPLVQGVLVGVIDGLGHGEEAATAARLAAATLEAYAHESILSLVRRCHEVLRGTRGVVMSLASFHAVEQTLTWLGVGNVEAVLLRADADANPARESVLLRGGIVGHQLPALHASAIPLALGDTLILATDGVRSGFADGLSLSEPPQQIADRVLAEHGKNTDDALVLVARYLGPAS